MYVTVINAVPESIMRPFSKHNPLHKSYHLTGFAVPVIKYFFKFRVSKIFNTRKLKKVKYHKPYVIYASTVVHRGHT